MNYKIALQNVRVPVPFLGGNIEIGSFEVNVTDIKILEMVSAMKEMPKIVKEMRDVIEAPSAHSSILSDAFAEMMAERFRDMQNSSAPNGSPMVLEALEAVTQRSQDDFTGARDENQGFSVYVTEDGIRFAVSGPASVEPSRFQWMHIVTHNDMAVYLDARTDHAPSIVKAYREEYNRRNDLKHNWASHQLNAILGRQSDENFLGGYDDELGFYVYGPADGEYKDITFAVSGPDNETPNADWEPILFFNGLHFYIEANIDGSQETAREIEHDWNVRTAANQ